MNELLDQTLEPIDEILTLKQEQFCRNYTQNSYLFGNATLSYAEAYGYDLDNLPTDDQVYEQRDGVRVCVQESTHKRYYHMCGAASSRLLKNVKIDKRIIELLNELMTDEQIDAEIAKVIKQNYDLPAKMRAIAEYNKLKQRIVEKKDITSDGKAIKIEFASVFNKENDNVTTPPETGGDSAVQSEVQNS